MAKKDINNIKLFIDDPSVIKLIQDQYEELSDDDLLRIDTIFVEKFDEFCAVDLVSLIQVGDPLADQIQSRQMQLMNNHERFIKELPKERAEKLAEKLSPVGKSHLPKPILQQILPFIIGLGILSSIWVIFFTDTYDSSSSQIDMCIEKSEKQFESCIYNIPGEASESDMNYCLDLHEARKYGCRTGRIK